MKVLFVCLGNICRSPLAEAIFNHKIRLLKLESFFESDSCGTGNYHIGGPADLRALSVAKKKGIVVNHVVRQLTASDLAECDYVLAMDKHNYSHIQRLALKDSARAKVRLMRDYDPNGPGDVPDPYHGTEKNFEEVYAILDRSIDQLIVELRLQRAT